MMQYTFILNKVLIDFDMSIKKIIVSVFNLQD